ncbi:hypothetical protein CEXT_144651 [Caerostris extrusa]|uniref:Uncharacterized protein n=1 Tax=Caerostris extrusa TaxID=172846 RepID=A0AAV4XJL3_CAEEX|nr:hypothetical protein CEXT_144651 [Caerostris extrusa]
MFKARMHASRLRPWGTRLVAYVDTQYKNGQIFSLKSLKLQFLNWSKLTGVPAALFCLGLETMKFNFFATESACFLAYSYQSAGGHLNTRR